MKLSGGTCEGKGHYKPGGVLRGQEKVCYPVTYCPGAWKFFHGVIIRVGEKEEKKKNRRERVQHKWESYVLLSCDAKQNTGSLSSSHSPSPSGISLARVPTPPLPGFDGQTTQSPS